MTAHTSSAASTSQRWSIQAAGEWYDRLPWLVGSNYIPRSAINQLEFWQPETFDPATIDQELGWAAAIGLNSMRVFLHNIPWDQDSKGYLARIEKFLAIAHGHGIGIIPVFFDSCWHPFPNGGPQRQAEPGVHNTVWVQCPGVTILRDVGRFARLESYVGGIVGHFRDDPRIYAWDIWNEPDNNNGAFYPSRDLGEAKAATVLPLMTQAFGWARAAKPGQPLTCGIWSGDWSCPSTLRDLERSQLELSDVISFHCYGKADQMLAKIHQLQTTGRPLICTEYMARGIGSTFQAILPLLQEHGVGAYNWGMVRGRTQTHLPWDSWQRPYTSDPNPWFHEIFHGDGKPYDEREVAMIRELAKKPKAIEPMVPRQDAAYAP